MGFSKKNIRELLDTVGLYEDSEDIYEQKNIVLRDGRNAILWENKTNGHGILDPEFWEKSNYYQEDYRKEFSANLNNFTNSKDHLEIYKGLNKRQYEQFAHMITHSTRFLEIGCSFGGIISLVNQNSLSCIHGIEPNKYDSEFIANKLSSARIFNSTFEEFEPNDVIYDLIVSFEVLEHVINLSDFVIKLSKCLERGGFINIEVPNHNDALLKYYKNCAYEKFYYHKAHIHYFTPKSLNNLFALHGFEGSISSFQIYPFFNQVFWIYNNKPQASATEALSYPKISVINCHEELEINKFFDDTQAKYLELMNQYLIGDSLVYSGRKL
ncbi:class I SAM-dependent methyltransferase [Fluviispira sanaruensis]|nr:class I SAM-dependent methyltransferase [Fluviispira sanaruensis]